MNTLSGGSSDAHKAFEGKLSTGRTTSSLKSRKTYETSAIANATSAPTVCATACIMAASYKRKLETFKEQNMADALTRFGDMLQQIDEAQNKARWQATVSMYEQQMREATKRQTEIERQKSQNIVEIAIIIEEDKVDDIMKQWVAKSKGKNSNLIDVIQSVDIEDNPDETVSLGWSNIPFLQADVARFTCIPGVRSVLALSSVDDDWMKFGWRLGDEPVEPIGDSWMDVE